MQLADVVQQGCPAELGGVLRGQAELLADQRRVGLDPLGVTAGEVVVGTDRGDEAQDLVGVAHLGVHAASVPARRALRCSASGE